MNSVPRDVWKLILNYCYRPKKILYAVLDLDVLNDGIHQAFPLCETPEEALEISYNLYYGKQQVILLNMVLYPLILLVMCICQKETI